MAYFDKVENLVSYQEKDNDESEDDDSFMTRSELSIKNLAVKHPKQAVDKLSLKYGKLKNEYAILETKFTLVSLANFFFIWEKIADFLE